MPLRDLIGHRRLVELIGRALDRGTLPPTLLFAGPAGIGKWQLAVALAQAANCLSPVRPDDGVPALDGCGECRACDRIGRGVHIDVLTLEPDEKASIKIEPVREVLERCGFRPFEGKRRFVLIRDADALETAAQNALLKSLEEPPPSTVFVLTSAVPGDLLSTVRSRCMRLPCARLTEEDVVRVLADHDVPAAEARAAAALADGSPGLALAHLAADLTEARSVASELLTGAARSPEMSERLALAKALVGTKPERTREELRVILRLTASMLRDLEAVNAGVDGRVLANADMVDTLTRLAPRYDGDRARRAFAAVERALYTLGRNAGTKLVAEWLASRI